MSRTTLLILMAVGVLVLGMLPVSPFTDMFRGQDKVLHVIAFAALAFMARVAFPRLAVGRLALVLLAGALAIEVAQGLWPRRNASWLDMWSNVIGVLVGLGCYRAYRALVRSRVQPPG